MKKTIVLIITIVITLVAYSLYPKECGEEGGAPYYNYKDCACLGYSKWVKTNETKYSEYSEWSKLWKECPPELKEAIEKSDWFYVYKKYCYGICLPFCLIAA